jgi:hypothetical protein
MKTLKLIVIFYTKGEQFCNSIQFHFCHVIIHKDCVLNESILYDDDELELLYLLITIVQLIDYLKCKAIALDDHTFERLATNLCEI